MIKFIEGGVCASKGYTASGVHCGVKGDGNTAKKLFRRLRFPFRLSA